MAFARRSMPSFALPLGLVFFRGPFIGFSP